MDINKEFNNLKRGNTGQNIQVMIFVSVLGFSIFGKYFFVILLFLGTAYLINKFKNNNFNLKTMASSSGIYDASSLGGKLASGVKKLIFTFIGFIFAIWILSSGIYVIEAGEVGVYSLFGKVREVPLQPGFHVVNPLADIIRMNVQTQEYTMSRATSEGKKTGDDSIAALTKEGLNISMDITVLYRLDSVQAANIYKTIGMDFEEKVIRPEIRSTIRGVASQYNAKEIYADKREEANDKIFAGLKKSMDSRGIILEQVLLRDVGLPADLAAAIQAKLSADQEAQKYDFLLEKEKKEKQRKIIEAEGQRDSQKIINESLSQNYLYYQYINSLKDRQGTMYIPVGTTNGMPLFKDLGK